MKKILGVLLVVAAAGTLAYYLLRPAASGGRAETTGRVSPPAAVPAPVLLPPLPEAPAKPDPLPAFAPDVVTAPPASQTGPAPDGGPVNPATPAFVVVPVPAADTMRPGVDNPSALATGRAAIPIDEPVPSAKATPTPGTVVYDAHLAALNSLAAVQNPYGPWKFGWSVGLTDPLVLFSNMEQSKQDNGQEAVWFDPTNYANVLPSVRYNFGPDFSNGDVTFKSGALLLTPGAKARPSFVHVVWTAPEDGNYTISCAFFGQQKGIGVVVDVLVRGAVVLTDAIMQDGASRPYVGEVLLHVGDTVDFAVGRNGGNLVTGLDALITKK